MVNIVYLDNEIFSMRDGTKEDIQDLWESDLEGISDTFKLFIFDQADQTMEKVKSLGNNTILILDMQMEVINGAEFLKSLRKENITIPVIAYTAYENDANDNMFMDLMQNDLFSYVKKADKNYSSLVNTINKAIEKFKDNIPLELAEALNEYLTRHEEIKNSTVIAKDGNEITFSNLLDHINKGTTLGKDYQKGMYKLAFEDLKNKDKKLDE